MRNGIRFAAMTCALWVTQQATGSAPSETVAVPETSAPCRQNLHDLVRYLVETAAVEGRQCSVEWQKDGSAIIRYSDFSQVLWCQHGEMHIRFDDPDPGN